MPGTLVYVGDKRRDEGKISITVYSRDSFEKKEVKKISDAVKLLKKPGKKWIDVDGLHNLKMIEEVGKEFGLHPILLEDIVNSEQRPKMDDYDEHLFFVLKAIEYHPRKKDISDEHIGIVLGKDFVISFQEKKPDTFETVFLNLKMNKGRLRKMGSDYLAYALMDSIVDNYFVTLEKIGERIGDLEEVLSEEPDPSVLRDIQRFKREMLFLRKQVWPLRDVFNRLVRRESPLIKKDTEIYLRDLYDHIVQIIDTTDTFNSMLSNMMDVYLSSISNKTNEVMKVLTVFTAVFIPLTFITGLYGMNFRYMPELGYEFGYYGALVAMALIALVLLGYFRKKEWI